MRRKRFSVLPIVSLAMLVAASVALAWCIAQDTPASNNLPAVQVIARGAVIPWALDFLPDGSVIFTERPGTVRLVDAEGSLLPDPVLRIDEVAAEGEGGLMGLALHPDFAANGYVYFYYTYRDNGGLQNKVVRYQREGVSFARPTVIVDGIPAASIHDGGRIEFGPDGLLYFTTGDAGRGELAQDVNSLAGKILRVTDNGSVPPDNPFAGSPVYSYGHRNPEGLAWDDQGRLWATEHGSAALDELNLIRPGLNYGWPLVRGDESAEGLEPPVLHSGGITWAPAGAAFVNGSLFFAGLRSQSLWEAALSDDIPTLTRYLEGEFGRLRAVVAGSGGVLYVTTSNRDGRGLPASFDDQIIKIDVTGLKGAGPPVSLVP